MSNIVYDIARVQTCQDCVIVMTNGDTSGMTDEQLEAWEHGLERTARALIDDGWEWSGVQCDSWVEDGVRCECDGEDHVTNGWFSWSPCEWCDSDLGGDRYNVAIMRRISE